MTDIVERLRKHAGSIYEHDRACRDAIIEIERLRDEIANLREKVENLEMAVGAYRAALQDRELARTQALEEAAKYIESRAYGDGMVDEPADDLSAAIRALKN